MCTIIKNYNTIAIIHLKVMILSYKNYVSAVILHSSLGSHWVGNLLSLASLALQEKKYLAQIDQSLWTISSLHWTVLALFCVLFVQWSMFPLVHKTYFSYFGFL